MLLQTVKTVTISIAYLSILQKFRMPLQMSIVKTSQSAIVSHLHTDRANTKKLNLKIR